jgi:hypothetical protein
MTKNRIRADGDINEPINEEACGRLMIELFGDNTSAMGEVLLHRAADAFCHDSTITPEIQAGFEAFANRMSRAEVKLAETIHPNESLGAPSARAMGKLFTANDAHEAHAPRRTGTFDLGSRLSEFLSSLRPRTLAWSATAAAAFILMQAAVITAVLVKKQEHPIQTALGPAAETAAFSPQKRDEEMAALVAGARQLMFAGDIPNARLALRPLAEIAGNAAAALELGATYDPFELAKLSFVTSRFGVEPSFEPESTEHATPDISIAQKWYQKAKDLGSTEAAGRLERLRSVSNPTR